MWFQLTLLQNLEATGKIQDKDFDVLLTLHFSIFILVINQLDAQNFCFTIEATK